MTNNQKRIQCRKCEGFGHIQSECANTLKMNKKSSNVTWSDDETDSNEDISKNIALTSVSSKFFCDSQVKERLVYLNNTIEKENSNSDESEICEESLTKSYKVMYEKWIHVTSENKLLSKINKQLSHQTESLELKIKEYETDLCVKDEKIIVKEALLVLDQLKQRLHGCSRHIIGDNDFLVNIRPMQCGEVTFGNGVTGNVISMGTLNFEGLPRLKNVNLIEGLKVNLLSIS
ncbi:uncharacterized protein LOC133031250 [Cannabis sativa]|uniref:uncharacterized protein LOC133031250 n=1 Tax=Cannabis sativa TaxID=3483 RepID=UPI0029C9C731|nr:uncharacterized protein LOC133031250 [Cannabis sativa]